MSCQRISIQVCISKVMRVGVAGEEEGGKGKLLEHSAAAKEHNGSTVAEGAPAGKDSTGRSQELHTEKEKDGSAHGQ